MVHDGSVRGINRTGLTDAQHEHLTALEQVKHPTEWQRGELAALRLSSPDTAARTRIDALTEKWQG